MNTIKLRYDNIDDTYSYHETKYPVNAESLIKEIGLSIKRVHHVNSKKGYELVGLHDFVIISEDAKGLELKHILLNAVADSMLMLPDAEERNGYSDEHISYVTNMICPKYELRRAFYEATNDGTSQIPIDDLVNILCDTFQTEPDYICHGLKKLGLIHTNKNMLIDESYAYCGDTVSSKVKLKYNQPLSDEISSSPGIDAKSFYTHLKECKKTIDDIATRYNWEKDKLIMILEGVFNAGLNGEVLCNNVLMSDMCECIESTFSKKLNRLQEYGLITVEKCTVTIKDAGIRLNKRIRLSDKFFIGNQ